MVKTIQETGRQMKEDTEKVAEFLDGFARALTAGDTDFLAAIWETPAFVVGDAGVHDVGSAEEVEAFFRGAKAQYNARGITDTRPDILRLEWITGRIAVVKVRWPYLDAKGAEVGEETSTYILRTDEAGALKIRVAVMHGESPRRT